jgi:hypothetical protein
LTGGQTLLVIPAEAPAGKQFGFQNGVFPVQLGNLRFQRCDAGRFGHRFLGKILGLSVVRPP